MNSDVPSHSNNEERILPADAKGKHISPADIKEKQKTSGRRRRPV